MSYRSFSSFSSFLSSYKLYVIHFEALLVFVLFASFLAAEPAFEALDGDAFILALTVQFLLEQLPLKIIDPQLQNSLKKITPLYIVYHKKNVPNNIFQIFLNTVKVTCKFELP